MRYSSLRSFLHSLPHFLPHALFRTTLYVALPLVLLVPKMTMADDLKIANAWISLPKSYENPSAYFIAQNQGKTLRTIVAATCSGCDWADINRAVLKDGAMATEKLVRIEIPGGGAVAFVPRGLSLALVGLSGLKADASVSIELEFADGEKVEFQAVVRDK